VGPAAIGREPRGRHHCDQLDTAGPLRHPSRTSLCDRSRAHGRDAVSAQACPIGYSWSYSAFRSGQWFLLCSNPWNRARETPSLGLSIGHGLRTPSSFVLRGVTGLAVLAGKGRTFKCLQENLAQPDFGSACREQIEARETQVCLSSLFPLLPSSTCPRGFQE
jgi:hypothetical protein